MNSQQRKVMVIRSAKMVSWLLKEPKLKILNLLRAEPDSSTGVAEKLKRPRQMVNYHIRELEKKGLIRCIETVTKRNCVERIMQPVAQDFLISPDVLGTLSPDPEDFSEDFNSNAHYMAKLAQSLSRMAELQKHSGDKVKSHLYSFQMINMPLEESEKMAQQLEKTIDKTVRKYSSNQGNGWQKTEILLGIVTTPEIQ
ncbi:winged helix-turn-helix domain-containing protein [bacterium]|nr:winged helix-turn-helix domain-containing protein [bacterium]